MRLLFMFIAQALFLLGSFESRAQTQEFFKKADQFFQTYITSDGKVHYKKLSQHDQPFKELTGMIARSSNSEKLEGDELKAFYLNAYNILAIKQVVNQYPIQSPKDVKGFFDGIKHKVAGEKMSLNQLEKQTLFQKFPDARLHLALVCAAKGCPPLWNHGFYAKKLDQQLDQQTKRALMDQDFIRVKPEERIAEISKIFQWYKKDFLAEANSILGYINKYRQKQLPADTRIRYYEYDWTLNSVQPPK